MLFVNGDRFRKKPDHLSESFRMICAKIITTVTNTLIIAAAVLLFDRLFFRYFLRVSNTEYNNYVEFCSIFK